MKSAELQDKSPEELKDLQKATANELFQARLQNYTNQLDDTSSLPRRRRDLARIQTELRKRELAELEANVQKALAGESS